MTYWRMQLHPSKQTSGSAVEYTVTSLAAHVIGLDFATDVGDLSRVLARDLRKGDRPLRAFAATGGMTAGDHVLVFTHNFPFALCRVAGEYKYVRDPRHVWFRHSREVDEVWFYGDWIKEPRRWKKIEMYKAFERLDKPETASYQLIDEWLSARPRQRKRQLKRNAKPGAAGAKP